LAPRLDDRLVQTVVEQFAVWQVRQGVVIGHMLELLFACLRSVISETSPSYAARCPCRSTGNRVLYPAHAGVLVNNAMFK
jgi:hypothetical protein